MYMTQMNKVDSSTETKWVVTVVREKNTAGELATLFRQVAPEATLNHVAHDGNLADSLSVKYYFSLDHK